jgi:uncharacterized protein YjbI with pentapeptide repeats
MAGRQRSHHQVQEPWALRNALAILAAGGAGAILAFVLSYWATDGDDKDRFDVGIKAATATAAIVAGVLTWGRLELSRGEQRLGVDRDLTERYGRAVEQLGDDETIIRIGGVFAMERFALDAMALSGFERDTDWRMALDLLAEFAREHSAHRDAAGPPTTSPGDPSADNSPGNLRDTAAPVEVAAAVSVLGRFFRRAGRPAGTVFYELSGIQVPGAQLHGAQLTIANLRGANLRGANLINANLINANLIDADLSDAHLNGVILSGANLSGANLNGVILSGADLSDANLEGTDLHQAILPDANLTGAFLSGADLRYANLDGANLDGANLDGANLTGAKLAGAKLVGAKLGAADLTDASLTGANLTGADLTEANLARADLSDTNLIDANFARAVHTRHTRWPEGVRLPQAGSP